MLGRTRPSNIIVILLLALPLYGCPLDSGSSGSSSGGLTPQPKRLIHYSETGEVELWEKYDYSRNDRLTVRYFDDPGRDNLWFTSLDRPAGELVCDYEQSDNPVHAIHTVVASTIFHSEYVPFPEGVLPSGSAAACPERSGWQLVRESRGCPQGKCAAATGNYYQLRINVEDHGWRLFHYQVLEVANESSSHDGELYRQMSEITLDEQRRPVEKNIQTRHIYEWIDAPLPECGGDLSVHQAMFSCPPARETRRYERSATHYTETEQYYAGGVLRDARALARAHDPENERVLETRHPDIPPPVDEPLTILELDDQDRVIREIVTGPGDDGVWFTDQDEITREQVFFYSDYGRPLGSYSEVFRTAYRYSNGKLSEVSLKVDLPFAPHKYARLYDREQGRLASRESYRISLGGPSSLPVEETLMERIEYIPTNWSSKPVEGERVPALSPALGELLGQEGD